MFLFFFASHSQVVALVLSLFLRSVITQAKYDDSSDGERLSTINLSRGSTIARKNDQASCKEQIRLNKK